MLFTEDHPDTRDLLVLDPQGRPVPRIKSIDLATGEVQRYALDPATGKVATRKANPLQQGLVPREVVVDKLLLAGYTLYNRREGRALGVTPGAAACELSFQLMMDLAPFDVKQEVAQKLRFATEEVTCLSPGSFCPASSTCSKARAHV